MLIYIFGSSQSDGLPVPQRLQGGEKRRTKPDHLASEWNGQPSQGPRGQGCPAGGRRRWKDSVTHHVPHNLLQLVTARSTVRIVQRFLAGTFEEKSKGTVGSAVNTPRCWRAYYCLPRTTRGLRSLFFGRASFASKTLTVGSDSIKLAIWDTAGAEQ